MTIPELDLAKLPNYGFGSRMTNKKPRSVLTPGPVRVRVTVVA